MSWGASPRVLFVGITRPKKTHEKNDENENAEMKESESENETYSVS